MDRRHRERGSRFVCDALRFFPCAAWQADTLSLSRTADTDSMASSLAMAYHLSHRYHQPEKAVALLQIDREAIDYRPENTLALDFARLNSVHADLLSKLSTGHTFHRLWLIALSCYRSSGSAAVSPREGCTNDQRSGPGRP